MSNEGAIEGKEEGSGTVQKLAALARISIPAEHAASFEKEFEAILAYISELDSLSLQTGAAPPVPPRHNAFREDGNSYTEGTWTKKIVAQFPAKEGDALSVKKILSYD